MLEHIYQKHHKLYHKMSVEIINHHMHWLQEHVVVVDVGVGVDVVGRGGGGRFGDAQQEQDEN